MSKVRNPKRDQQLPVDSLSGDKTPIVDLIVGDLFERKQHGIQKYGKPLIAHNGRNSIKDAYEEALDLSVYLRQALAESQTSFMQARTIMRNAFADRRDGEVYSVYISNIAMLLHDRFDIKDYQERNSIAREIMKLVFDL